MWRNMNGAVAQRFFRSAHTKMTALMVIALTTVAACGGEELGNAGRTEGELTEVINRCLAGDSLAPIKDSLEFIDLQDDGAYVWAAKSDLLGPEAIFVALFPSANEARAKVSRSLGFQTAHGGNSRWVVTGASTAPDESGEPSLQALLLTPLLPVISDCLATSIQFPESRSGVPLSEDPPNPDFRPPRGPSGSDGSFNCDDFDTQQQAQRWFEEVGDVDGLDRDGDGVPCQSLP